MISSTINFTCKFDLDKDSATYGKFVLTDTSPYSTEGIALADVNGFFRMDFPDGDFYQGNIGSPDIVAGTSLVFSAENLPVDAYDYFLKGTYTFLYTIIVGGAVQAGTYTKTQIFNFCPEFSIIKGNYAKPSVTSETNCNCLKISASDTTDYGNPTSITYDFKLYGPVSIYGATAVASSNTTSLTYVFSWTGIYEAAVNTLATYVDGNFTIVIRVKGLKDFTVTCDRDLCALYSCMKEFGDQVLASMGSLGGFDKLPRNIKDKWIGLQELIRQLDQAQSCGKYNDAGDIYDDIASLLNCSCKCDSTDDTPKMVSPYCGCAGGGGGGDHNTVSAGSQITVTATNVGDHIDYEVAVSAAFITLVNNINTSVTELIETVDDLQAQVDALGEPRYTLLHSDLTGFSTSSGTTQLAKSYTLSADTLDVDDDYIRIKVVFGFELNGSPAGYFGVLTVQVDGTSVSTGSYQALGSNFKGVLIIDVFRNASNQQITYRNTQIPSSPPRMDGVFEGTLSKDLTTDLDIEVYVNVTSPTGSETIGVDNFTVEHFKQA